MKVCSRCKVEKDESEFSKNNRNKTDGLQPRCKSCFKQYCIDNAEKIRIRRGLYYEKNQDEIKRKSIEWNSNNKEKKSNTYREYRKNNIERIKLNKKNYYEKNKDRENEKSRIFVLNNRNKVRAYKSKYNKKIRVELCDSYIKRLIADRKFPSSAIPQDLVDFHREVIRAKRLKGATKMKHITDVRQETINIFNQLKAGTIDPKVASEMLNAAGKITSMCKAQLTYHALRREAPDMPFLASNGK